MTLLNLTAIVLIVYVLIGAGLCMVGPLSGDLAESIRGVRANLAIDMAPVKWARFSAFAIVVMLAIIFGWPLFLRDKRREPAPGGKNMSRHGDVRWVGDFVELGDHLRAAWNPSFDRLLYLRTPGTWKFGLSPAFQKAIGGVDKKLQGRILEAISGICDDPMTVQGDTKKPLEGNLKGLWRYRIGDFRLVYRPDNVDNVVVLVDFVARGTEYSGVGD